MKDISHPNPSPATLREPYIQKNFPELYVYLMSLPSDLPWNQRTYWFYHDIEQYPMCPVCGNRLKFHCTGYPKTCSTACSRKFSGTAELKKTCLERYGVDNPAKLKSVRNKMHNTNVANYGTEYRKVFSERAIVTNKELNTTNPNRLIGIQAKMHKTKQQKYGDAHYNNRTKAQQTCLERYGVSHFSKSNIGRRMISAGHKTHGLQTKDFLIGYTDSGDWVCKCPHPGCTHCQEKSYIIPFNVWHDRNKDGTEPCTKILPIGRHLKDTTLELFIQGILESHDIKYEHNNRIILGGRELDFVIDNVAIEVNGCYWHSDRHKIPEYHINKYIDCQSEGIKLLTIWEDQIIRIPEIVESVVLSKLGIYKRRLQARKCVIKEIGSQCCSNFLEHNHIQGRTSSQVRLGAYINNELVGVMTFIQSRGCQGSKVRTAGQWELNRFCTLLNTQVIGLTSKMLKYFIRHYQPASIISFSHNDISDGNVYSKLGFTKTGRPNASYYYIKSNVRYHRSNFTRAGIVRRWPEYDINDKSWTERQVMNDKNYYRIYDCGTQKWILHVE